MEGISRDKDATVALTQGGDAAAATQPKGWSGSGGYGPLLYRQPQVEMPSEGKRPPRLEKEGTYVGFCVLTTTPPVSSKYQRGMAGCAHLRVCGNWWPNLQMQISDDNFDGAGLTEVQLQEGFRRLAGAPRDLDQRAFSMACPKILKVNPRLTYEDQLQDARSIVLNYLVERQLCDVVMPGIMWKQAGL